MFNVRVEYDITPIRHIAVQCPKCNNWFNGRDITEKGFMCETDIHYATFTCPVCREEFGGRTDKPKIEEVDYPKVYDGCLQKKEVWG